MITFCPFKELKVFKAESKVPVRLEQIPVGRRRHRVRYVNIRPLSL